MGIHRTVGRLLSAAFCLFAPASGALRAQSDGDTGEALRQALVRLANLEEQIGRVQQQQRSEQERLEEAGETLERTRERLERREQIGGEARGALEQARAGQGVTLDALRSDLETERRTAREEREASRASSALLVWEATRPAGDTRALATLALLERHHRRRSQVASARALRMEGERTQVEAAMTRAVGSEHYYSSFEQYSLRQLREQRGVLVGEVHRLQAALDGQSGELEQLAARQIELEGLIAQLTTPVEVAPTPVESRVEADGADAVADSEADEAEATAEAQAASGSGLTQAGPRSLFWHARAVGVIAPVGGRVVFSGGFAGYRHLLIVDLGGGWHVLFGNLSECRLAVGATVAAGQRVGEYQAAQGDRAAPFWLEVRRGVEAVTPERCPLLPENWRERLFVMPPPGSEQEAGR
jgi:murein DD-endopeptidase MepM/ murein hydrolase activator NlpD